MGEQTSLFDLVPTLPAQPATTALDDPRCDAGSVRDVEGMAGPLRGSTGQVEADDATTDKRIVARSMTPAQRRRGGWS